ncbi:MAG: outer membrane beta-barrel protein [Burkholderiales bacterium]
MKRFGMLCALLAGALFAAQAEAQSAGQGYFGLGYGVTWSDPIPYAGTLVNSSASAGKVYGGYMYSNWGVEMGYYNLGNYDANINGATVGRVKTQAITVAGVYSAPFGGAFNLRARLGIAFTDAEFTCPSSCGTLTDPDLNVDTKQHGVAGMGGFGIGAKFAQDVSVQMDYEHFGSVNHKVNNTPYNAGYDLLTLSLQFAF